MAKDHAAVDDKWSLFNSRILYEHEDFSKVEGKLTIAQDTSSLETDDGDSRLQSKRNKRPPSRYVEENEEAPVSQQCLSIPVPVPPPAPPKVRRSLCPSPAINLPPPSRSTVLINTPPSQPLTPQISQVQSSGFQQKVISLLTEIKMEVGEIKNAVQLNTSLLNMSRNEPVLEEGWEMPKDICFPLHTFDDLMQIETLICEDPTFSRGLISKLVLIGGSDINSTVAGILMTAALQVQFNWTGTKGKLELRKLALVKVILKATRRQPKHKHVTINEIGKACVKFLANSRDREGGRQKRQKPIERETVGLQICESNAADFDADVSDSD